MTELNADAVDVLVQTTHGSAAAAAKLTELLYAELRALAAAGLVSERAGHTLQPTALVHEAFLRLVGQRQVDWKNKAHFMALAAVTIRRILVDHARGKSRQKRRGPAPSRDEHRVMLEQVLRESGVASGDDIIGLHEALERLSREHERRAKVVELRFFGGLRVPDVALILGISDRAVEEDWRLARIWLMRELNTARA